MIFMKIFIFMDSYGQPDELVWYLDGKEVFEEKLTKELHIIFDAEIMETWDGLQE